jgi:hypothetical protein
MKTIYTYNMKKAIQGVVYQVEEFNLQSSRAHLYSYVNNLYMLLRIRPVSANRNLAIKMKL